MTGGAQSRKRLVWRLIVCAAALLMLGLRAAVAQADNIVQGYNSTDSLQFGLLVELDKSAAGSVKVLPGNDADHIFGVVVNPAEAPLMLGSQTAKVYVATSGNFQVLVSTAGGAIKPGDFITISNLAGIAQRASAQQSRILGQATSAFDGGSGVVTTSGSSKIGRIGVQINPQNNPLASNAILVPSFLRKASDALAGKSVSALRIYASLGVFIFSAVVAILVLWSGVRGSLVALGRNPLSRKAIFSGMYKVVFTGLSVFIIGLAGVYLLLKI